jgi:serine/threonine protein kinase
MSLASRTRLGPYEIQSALGAGGMGEVYRARDPKLGREVALRIVSEAFTHDPERVARFHREAQLLAALNRPHIATIHYGADGRRAGRRARRRLGEGAPILRLVRSVRSRTERSCYR